MYIKKIHKKLACSWLPRRQKDSNKGTYGRLYIIAGSRGMVGAGILSSWGAMKVGTGLVRLATVKSQQVVAARRAPLEVATQALPESKDGTLSKKSWRVIQKTVRTFKPHVLVSGPGLGQSASSKEIILNLWKTSLPLLLDADGLNILATSKPKPRKAPLIITPHPGEMARLLNSSVKKVQRNREKIVQQMAKKLKCICVLKGAGTLISDGKTVYKNTTGNSGLASGGTGDVLAGVIAGLWGQYANQDLKTAFNAASLGVYLHGSAGDIAAKKLGEHGMLASDVSVALPKAILKIT